MTEPKQKQYGPLTILSQKDVADLLGVAVSSVQKMRKSPDFPKRRRFGAGPRGWIYSEIETWVKCSPIDDKQEDEGEEVA